MFKRHESTGGFICWKEGKHWIYQSHFTMYKKNSNENLPFPNFKSFDTLKNQKICDIRINQKFFRVTIVNFPSKNFCDATSLHLPETYQFDKTKTYHFSQKAFHF